MSRRVWIGSIATTVAWANVALAQSPQPTAPAGSTSTTATEGAVFVMRTAGQPERRVKVIKSEQLPDGSFLTDVKDLTTGAVYSLTNPAVLDRSQAAAATAAPAPAAPAPTPEVARVPAAVAMPKQAAVPATTGIVPTVNAAPQSWSTPRPLFGSFPNQQQSKMASGLPQARNRATDPLLANQNPTSLLGRFFGEKDQPAPRVGVLPQAQTQVQPQAVAQVAQPQPVTQQPITISPIVMPTVAPEQAVAVPKRVEPAVSPPAFSTADLMMPQINVAARPQPPVTPPVVAQPSIAQAAAASPPGQPRTFADDLPGEIKVMLNDVLKHKRPSFRMENVTSLTESAHARHPDVIAVLLHAAKNDSTGVVRGHCLSQLAAVGHNSQEFLQLLEAGMSDAEPAVRRGAATAKSTLGLR